MKTLSRIFVLAMLTGPSLSNGQWVQQKSGTDGTLVDVVMLDTTTAIAVGRDRSILRTTDAGMTWFNVAAPMSSAVPRNRVSFFDTANGIAVGDGGVVVTTTDGGNTWWWHYIPGGQKCLSALHLGPGNIYVGADSGWIYHSLDSGNTWSSQQISSWPIRSLFAWRGAFVMGFPIYALTPYSLCTKMEFPSGPWSETILSQFQGLGSEAFSGEFCNGGGAGFIVGVQGDLRAAPTILRKSMSDSAWRSVSSSISKDGTLLGVSAPSANVIYVCGSNGMMFKSSNGGDTWAAHTIPTAPNLHAVYFIDENQGFAVGDSGTIFHTSNGGVTGVNDREGHLPMRFVLHQNYPNPFNPTTNFGFRIVNCGFVSLEVYDILGRVVATPVNEVKQPGDYSVRWDATKLPGGVYFCRLTAGAYTDAKKLLLLK